MNAKKKIWIDLDNSPHVPFFMPIIQELEKKGFDIYITTRDCFQVCGLAELLGLNYKKIGRHYGKNKIMKVIGTLFRAAQLLSVALRQKPMLSISHGSRSQLIVSYLLRIPKVLLFDYEHSKGLGFVKPRWEIGPEVITQNTKYFKPEYSLRYPGLKEDVYVGSFKPLKGFRQNIGIEESDILVTIRPPATEAHYHNPESEKLFAKVLNHLASFEQVRMLILPRNEIKQKDFIIKTWKNWYNEKKIIIPEHVLNGLDVIWNSDFVISGGGTMNREAAALNVPVYSIFRGTIGDVDKYLTKAKRLVLIEKEEDVEEKIKIEKRTIRFDEIPGNKETLKTIVSHLENIIASL